MCCLELLKHFFLFLQLSFLKFQVTVVITDIGEYFYVKTTQIIHNNQHNQWWFNVCSCVDTT